jgi:hypothetical protein
MNTPSRSLVLHTRYLYTAAVLLVSILASLTGIPFFHMHARAAYLEQVRDTLSTSKPGVGADHTIQFETPTGIPDDGSTMTITFPSGFSMGLVDEDDVDVADDGVDLTTGAACGAVEAAVTVSGQVVTIEVCSGGGGAIAGGSIVTVEIGTNATSSGTGVNRIANHATPGSYQLTIGGTMDDSGFTRIVVLEQVIVTGAVQTYFEFSIDGVNAGQTVNADPTTTFATTTATTVPFGLVQPGTEYVLGQNLSVTTNAENGFTVTVTAAGDLTSTGGGTINSFTNGTDVATPQGWASPSALSGNTDTYGHWGITSEDVTLTDNDSFGNALYAGNFIGTPREVMYATSSADGTTPHIGTTRVGYKLEISAMQEAGNDYTTTLTYVATPTF